MKPFKAIAAMSLSRMICLVKNIGDFKFEDFELTGYDPYPAIKAPIAV